MKIRGSFLRLAVGLVVGTACMITACGDDGEGTSPTNGGDAGPDAPDAQPGARDKSAAIFVQQRKYIESGKESFLYIAGANFYDMAKANPATPEVCNVVADGSCTVRTCPSAGVIPAQGKQVTAGLIEIRGAQINPPLKLEPWGEHGEYTVPGGRSLLWSGGEGIDVAVQGDEAVGGPPAFGTTLKAPSFITLSSPTWPPAPELLTIDRTRDLELAWSATGEPAGVVEVSFFDKTTRVSCTYPTSEKQVRLPSSTLSKLSAGAATFEVGVHSKTAMQVNDWNVEIGLFTQANHAAGGGALGQVKLR